MARKAAAAIAPEAKPQPEPVPSPIEDVEVDIGEPARELEQAAVETPAGSTEGAKEVERSTPEQEEVTTLRQRLAEMERAEAFSRQQNQETQRQLTESQTRQRRSEWQAWEDRKTAVDNLIGGAQSARDAAKQEYRAAAAENDIDRMTEAQDRLAEAAATIQTFSREKSQMEEREAQWKRQREQQPRQQQQPQQQQPQSVEQIINAASIPERAKVWLRAHPDYVTDPAKNEELRGLHRTATRLGGGEFTEGYFNNMENLLGMTQEVKSEVKPNGGNGAQQTQSVVQRQSAPVSAPTSREAPSMSTGRAPSSNKIYLNKEEVAVALASKLREDEPDKDAIERYARNKQKMIRMKGNGEIS